MSIESAARSGDPQDAISVDAAPVLTRRARSAAAHRSRIAVRPIAIPRVRSTHGTTTAAATVGPPRIARRVPRAPAPPAGRALAWLVILAGLLVVQAWPSDPVAVRLNGLAAVASAMVIGYRYAPALHLSQALRRWWRGLARPYLVWLVLLGVPTLVVELATDGGGQERAWSLLAGGAALDPPLRGLALLGALVMAALLAHCAEAWLAVDPVWLLPGALALTSGAPLLYRVPPALGLGATLLTWLLLGRLLALVPRLPGERWSRAPLGALLAVGGTWLALGPAGPVDPMAGRPGPALVGPAAAAAAGAGLILLGEELAAWMPARARRILDRATPLAIVALASAGVGAHLVPGDAGPAASLAAGAGGVVLAVAAVLLLPRGSWLCDRVPAAASGRPIRRGRRTAESEPDVRPPL